ncbi:DUF397 domain-containing protein [Streptomyces sp. NPDC059814]|uniref:DUF397 domain-containing protein n=1 Tax=Streptomyces sp. NPDC059814 TaxID=3346959 RepID=UPI00365FC22A
MAVIPDWRTSTCTKSDSCVEVADNGPAAVMVRDTKVRRLGTLFVPPLPGLSSKRTRRGREDPGFPAAALGVGHAPLELTP